jgi:glycosyltransferase involved in cell wall biosynthesis
VTRILFLVQSLGTGGIEKLVYDLATALEPSDFSVSVAAFEDGHMREALAARGVAVHVLSPGVADGVWGGSLGRFYASRERLRRLARNFDVVHSHNLATLLKAAMASFPRRPWRWVHTEHVRPDSDTGCEPWLTAIAPHLLRLPDTLTGVAPGIQEYLSQRVPTARQRTLTIVNGIDVDYFARRRDRAAKRAELGFAPEEWVIGTVGTLRPQKNHRLLLDAFARLGDRLPEARLVIAGGGDLRGSLEAWARERGVADRTRFLGSRLDVAELLAAFDAYCLPSHYEGMPLSLFEAMAAGVPVIATDVLGSRDVVRTEATGLLVPAGDAEALADALVRLRREPALAGRLAAAGRAYVAENARLETMIDRYADVYHALARTRVAS